MLGLCARRFKGRRLRPDEYVISADEKSLLQALGRRYRILPPVPGRSSLCEFGYRGGGTLAYLAAWDVHHAKPLRPGRENRDPALRPPRRGVMSSEHYASARRVAWVVDNG